MKFKFCSDGDCPLWVLAGLNAVGSLPSSLFKRLLDQVVEEQSEDGIMDLLKDTNLASRDECARAAIVIRWALKSAWRSRCEGSQLTRDLLVIGVPRAHANVIAEAADAGRAKYETGAKDSAFMVNRVTDASISEGPEGSLDSLTLTLHTDDVFTGVQKQHDIMIQKLQVPTLLEELRRAYDNMEEFGVD